MNLILRVPRDKEFQDLDGELADALKLPVEEQQMPESGIRSRPRRSK